ncbi:MAG: SigE family RNA polymerase sigma factor [Dermatophilaceae bacterium]
MNGPVDFDAYVQARWAGLVRSAVLLTGDRHAAEDLVQETLLRAAQHWHRIDPATADAYVRRILYTRSIDAWRWRRRQPAPAMVSERHTDDVGHAADRRVHVARALRLLTPKQRAVLVLRFFEDRTEADTAALLDCSVSTVKSNTRDALARLRSLAPDLAVHLGREEVRQ